jgi:hypothetical protein
MPSPSKPRRSKVNSCHLELNLGSIMTVTGSSSGPGPRLVPHGAVAPAQGPASWVRSACSVSDSSSPLDVLARLGTAGTPRKKSFSAGCSGTALSHAPQCQPHPASTTACPSRRTSTNERPLTPAFLGLFLAPAGVRQRGSSPCLRGSARNPASDCVPCPSARAAQVAGVAGSRDEALNSWLARPLVGAHLARRSSWRPIFPLTGFSAALATLVL